MVGIDNYEYAQWVINIGRSLRLNPAVDAELAVCTAFYSYEETARPWLAAKFGRNSAQGQGLVTTDNPQVIGKQLEAIGRNMMKIQIIDIAEKMIVDVLIAATDDRRFGVRGARSGSDVDQTP